MKTVAKRNTAVKQRKAGGDFVTVQEAARILGQSEDAVLALVQEKRTGLGASVQGGEFNGATLVLRHSVEKQRRLSDLIAETRRVSLEHVLGSVATDEWRKANAAQDDVVQAAAELLLATFEKRPDVFGLISDAMRNVDKTREVERDFAQEERTRLARRLTPIVSLWESANNWTNEADGAACSDAALGLLYDLRNELLQKEEE